MRLTVSNMSCGHCVRAITKAIHAVDSTADVRVDLQRGSVEVIGSLSGEAATEAIKAAGYPAALDERGSS